MFRRLLTASALLAAAVLASLLTLASPATAAPYPPSNPPSLSASAYDPCAGASNIIGGNGFQAGERVQLILDGRVIADVTVGADGSFETTVTIPQDARGSEQVLAVGQTSGLNATTTLSVTCVLGQSQTQLGSGSGSGSGGGLASTGVAVGGILGAAALLLGGGIVLTVAGRRRRGTTAVG